MTGVVSNSLAAKILSPQQMVEDCSSKEQTPYDWKQFTGDFRKVVQKPHLNEMEVFGIQQFKGIVRQDFSLKRWQPILWNFVLKINWPALSDSGNCGNSKY